MIIVSDVFTLMYAFADELLAPYGKEMTWDIKAGLMGKRELYPDLVLCVKDVLARSLGHAQ